ncbi:MAG: peptidylprolyl isomerase [Pyrinomonadaceae bacterium]
MLKKISIILLLIAALASFACNSTPKTSSDGEPIVKEGVKPVADEEVAVIEMENPAAFGSITIELYSNIAPKMVARFKELAKSGFYNGTTFHRVNGTVIQGGDPNSKDNDPTNDGMGGSDKPDVEAEFSDIEYDTAIVGAARMGNDVNSQNAQFFIMLRREAQFDRNYTVFGKVIDGMNNARTIAGSPRNGERPIEDVKIKTITFKKKEAN